MNDENTDFENLADTTKVRFFLATLFFVVIGAFTVAHLGFSGEQSRVAGEPFLTRENLWIINSILGLVGGFLFDYRRFIIGGISGLIAALAITGATLFYLSWRDSIYYAEVILPLMSGVVGMGVHSLLKNISK